MLSRWLNAQVSSSPDCVRVEFPAQTVNMAIARAVAAAIAARADLTVDQIEDVRLAMDETLSHVMSVAAPDSSVLCEMCVTDGIVSASIRCPVASPDIPEPNPFSWTVLSALVGDVDVTIENNSIVMSWSVARDSSVQA